MKVIGLIGGMSWESSAEYYRIVNESVRDEIGPTSSARCILWSFDFSEIKRLQHDGDWDTLTKRMIDAAQRLEAAGAEILVICTNTMHKMAEDIEKSVAIPLLHIADPTGCHVKQAGIDRVGLLGTSFTMEQEFYRGRLRDLHGLNVIVPDETDRSLVHRIIYEELVAGKILPESRAAYREVIARLIDSGAQGIILGCTEIMLLVEQDDCAVPLFDTTTLHAKAAVSFSLSDEKVL